jgi:hypothetical protein
MQVTIIDAGDLKAVNRELKRQADGKELRKQLGKQLRSEIRPMVRAVKAAWLSAPSEGHSGSSRGRRGQPDLRRLLAKATAGQVRFTGKEAGVRVRTDGRKMPSGSKALPGYAEGIRRRPWRHPVFGEWTAKTKNQRPFPRFFQAVQPDESRARQACEQAVDQVLNKIARA